MTNFAGSHVNFTATRIDNGKVTVYGLSNDGKFEREELSDMHTLSLTFGTVSYAVETCVALKYAQFHTFAQQYIKTYK